MVAADMNRLKLFGKADKIKCSYVRDIDTN